MNSSFEFDNENQKVKKKKKEKTRKNPYGTILSLQMCFLTPLSVGSVWKLNSDNLQI